MSNVMVDGPTSTVAARLLGLAAATVLAGWLVATVAVLAEFRPGSNSYQAVAAASGDVSTTSPTSSTPLGVEAELTVPVDPGTGSAAPAADVTRVLGTDANVAYRVVRGDTLSGIGDSFGIDWRLLAEINDLSPPYLIGIGRIIQIPDPTGASGEVAEVVAADADLQLLDASFDVWSDVYGVPAELAKAVAWRLTQWDSFRVGESGERGVGQLLPEVEQFVADEIIGSSVDSTDPDQSAQVLTAYLGFLLDATQGDTSATLAAYSQGLQSIDAIGWQPETIEFIAEVVGIRPDFVS